MLTLQKVHLGKRNNVQQFWGKKTQYVGTEELILSNALTATIQPLGAWLCYLINDLAL